MAEENRSALVAHLVGGGGGVAGGLVGVAGEAVAKDVLRPGYVGFAGGLGDHAHEAVARQSVGGSRLWEWVGGEPCLEVGANGYGAGGGGLCVGLGEEDVFVADVGGAEAEAFMGS